MPTPRQTIRNGLNVHNEQFPSIPTIHTKELFSGAVRIVSVVELALNHWTTYPLSYALNINVKDPPLLVAVSLGVFAAELAVFSL
ncbi:hypothetical protein ACTXT7_008422 [Hymenolepis weldensis]